MRLFYTTRDFIYKGRPYPGIPFLCSEDMERVGPASDYLMWVALENGRTRSLATWKSYAEAMYDYFAWLEVNCLDWDALPIDSADLGEISNLALYRNWSLNVLDANSSRHAMQPSTVRKRLSQIMRFYEWAATHNRIGHVPWDVQRSRIGDETLRGMIKASTLPRVARQPIRFLTTEQCRALLANCNSSTVQLMTKLMLQTGLRSEECRTFPTKYLFDPAPERRSRKIPIDLSPSDMKLKGSRPRRIYASGQLIKDLFDFANFGEGAMRAKLYRMTQGVASPYVFLNRHGTPWSEKGLCNAYRKLWKPAAPARPVLDFKVTPHMLRHYVPFLTMSGDTIERPRQSDDYWLRRRRAQPITRHSLLCSTKPKSWFAAW